MNLNKTNVKDIIVISNYNIEGAENIILALDAKISGLGRSVLTILLRTLNISETIRANELLSEEIESLSLAITKLLKKENIFANIGRPIINDIANGIHHIGQNLRETIALNKNFLKKIRDYRGRQHKAGHKVRHQKSKSTGRKNRKVAIKKK